MRYSERRSQSSEYRIYAEAWGIAAQKGLHLLSSISTRNNRPMKAGCVRE